MHLDKYAFGIYCGMHSGRFFFFCYLSVLDPLLLEKSTQMQGLTLSIMRKNGLCQCLTT